MAGHPGALPNAVASDRAAATIAAPGSREPGGKGSYRGSVAFGASSFGSVLVVAVAGSIVTSRIYGINVIGAYALASAPVAIVGFLSSVREQAALVRELAVLEPRAPRVTGLFAAVYCFSLTLTVIVGGVGFVATALLFRGPLHHPELVLPAAVNLAIYVILTNASWNLDAVFTAFRVGRSLFWIRLGQGVAFLVFAVVAGLALGTIWGLVLATGAAALTGLLHRVIVARSFIRWAVERDELREGFRTLPDLIRFGMRVTPGIVATALSQEAGTWALAATGSLGGVGGWSRAWGLSSRFLDLSSRVTEVLFPTLVSRRSKGDGAGFDRALIDSARYSAAGLLLLAAVGGGAATDLMRLFGHGFDRAAGALTLTLLVPVLFSLSSIQRHVLYAVGRPTLTTISGLARLGFTIGAVIPLTIADGPTGTALALVLGVFAELGCMFRATQRALETPLHRLWPLREFSSLLVAYAAGFGAARGLIGTTSSGLALPVALVGGTVVYCGALVLAGGTNSRDRARATEVLALVHRGRFGGGAAS